MNWKSIVMTVGQFAGFRPPRPSKRIVLVGGSTKGGNPDWPFPVTHRVR